MARILHTADVHIGKVFEQFGAFGEKLRGQIKGTFRRVFDLAANEHVEAVILAGDIFDSGSIARSDIRFFMDVVGSINPVPVYFLPGTWTHDSRYQKAIYRTPYFLGDKPDNLYVFSEDRPQSFRAISGQLAVHGRAVLPESGNPLDGIKPDPEAAYNIAVLHTGISLPHIPEEPGKPPLKLEHVQGCAFDYLAMGDWHCFRRYFDDARTVVQYSGSPETVQFKDGEESGYVALVTFEEGGPKVQRRPVGHYRWRELTLQWNTVGSVKALQQQLLQHASSQTILRVVLKGTLTPKDPIGWEDFREKLEPHFTYFELDTGQVKQELPLDKIEKEYRKNTVERTFVTLLKADLEKTQQRQEQERLGEALRRGHALFQGLEDLP